MDCWALSIGGALTSMIGMTLKGIIVVVLIGLLSIGALRIKELIRNKVKRM